MQVLVADEDIASRVMVETVLRERGHTVRNCDDGFESAKLLSASPRPRMALISNTLERLRGLDVSRFLSATGKKGGVYLLLVCDVLDMELMELCRRAGVDDVIIRPFSAAQFAARLEVAERYIEMEEELLRMQGIIQNLSAYETPMQKKARALREANAALLGVKKEEEPQTASAAPEQKAAQVRGTAAAAPRPASARPVVEEVRHERVYRGFQIVADKPSPHSDAAAHPAPAQSGKSAPQAPRPAQPQKAAQAPSPAAPASQSVSQAELDAMLGGAVDMPHHEEQQVLASAQQVQDEELADEELIHPFEFDEIILSVFSGMGVTLKSELPPKPLAEGAVFASWVGVAMPKAPVWMDVMLLAGAEAASAVTKELLGQSKVSESDICEMFAELQNMVQGSLRRYLEENGHKPVLQLAIPRAARRDTLPPLPSDGVLVESGFSINGEPILAVLFEHRQYETYDSATHLKCYDFVCDAVQLENSTGELIVAGAIVRAREKGIIEGKPGRTLPFRAMRASPLAKAIGPGLLLEAPGTAVCCKD